MSLLSQTAIRVAYHFLKWAGDDTSKGSKNRFRKILDHANRQQRRVLLSDIVQATGRIVSDGPFAGQVLSPETCKHDIFVGSKLLGYYEREIQDLIASWRNKTFDAVINIGSASGFFAVGSSRLLEPKHVWAVDIEQAELDICRENFELNGRSSGVTYLLSMNGAELAELAQSHPKTLIISDCEGFEDQLFTPDTSPSLAKAHLIIECHDFAVSGITEKLMALFEASHDLQIIEEGARDPNTSELLRSLPSRDRWLVISEERPETMRWLIAVPKR